MTPNLQTLFQTWASYFSIRGFTGTAEAFNRLAVKEVELPPRKEIDLKALEKRSKANAIALFGRGPGR